MSVPREEIDEDLPLGLFSPESPLQSSTVRPTQPLKVPASLRSLFPEEPSDANESPATPTLQYPPMLAPPLIIPTTSSQARTAKRTKRLGEIDDELQHTHRGGFVFPPRPKQAADFEKSPEQKLNSPKVPSPKFQSPSAPQLPTQDDKLIPSDDEKVESTRISPTQNFFHSPVERKRSRSKSSAADTNAHSYPPPGEYRFPMSNGLPTNPQRPLHLLSKVNRRSPTLDSLERIYTSPSHQSTHSLDAVTSGRISPSPSRSALNVSRPLYPALNSSPDRLQTASKPPLLRPNLIRQASVAVMETVPSPPLLPPVPPLVRQRQRSGNSVSGNSDFLAPNVPGLKDVLKVLPSFYYSPLPNPLRTQVPHLTSEHQLGMADLLPPSPSAFGPTSTKTPSPLNNISGNNSLSSSLTTSLSVSASRSQSRSPPPLDLSQSSPNFSAGGMDGMYLPPPIRSLDLGGLMRSRDDTHAELAHIVEDLAQWLAVVENGLSDLLASPAVDTIEEEQEELGGYHDESLDGLEGRYESQTEGLSTPHAFLSHSGLPT